jgi:hypothetical protein
VSILDDNRGNDDDDDDDMGVIETAKNAISMKGRNNNKN